MITNDCARQKIAQADAEHNTDLTVRKLLKIPALCALVFLLVQTVAGVAVYSSFDDWNTRGTFGDMFGVVTALFSGLALAGVIYTMVLQRRELGLQWGELRRAAEAHEASLRANVMRDLFREIDAPEIHAARNFVYSNHQSYWAVRERPEALSALTHEMHRNATIVSNSFDRVGVLVAEKLVGTDAIVRVYGPSIARSWIALEPFIKALRKERYHSTYEEFFEQIAKIALSTWPRDEVCKALDAWTKQRETSGS